MPGRMDKLCSMCQAGVPHDCSPPTDPQDELRKCVRCDDTFNVRSASLGSDVCPRCERVSRRRSQ